MATDTKKLIRELAAEEEASRREPFVAPCIPGARLRTRVAGMVQTYRPEPREQMREVMRFAGPRMLARHPWLAILHLLDARTKAPPPKKAVKRCPESKLREG